MPMLVERSPAIARARPLRHNFLTPKNRCPCLSFRSGLAISGRTPLNTIGISARPNWPSSGYFARNLRAIEVLIDRDVIANGKAAQELWKFYDLGHGYCTYDFFDQCPHRMACAKCAFYLPKGSTKAHLLEGKSNLLRLRQEIPLNETELAAVEDGVEALEKLLSQLADVPTPAGPTPRQLQPPALVTLEACPVRPLNQESTRNDAQLG